jgi:hypothetical protein
MMMWNLWEVGMFEVRPVWPNTMGLEVGSYLERANTTVVCVRGDRVLL